jgi:exopolysaccharide biosynthesis polyprenyl glycosylphosphotransferase
MATLASPLRALLPAPHSPPPASAAGGRRCSDARDQHHHEQIGGAIALGEATNAVQRRTAVFRRALVLADILSAAFALALSVQILGDDRLRLATLIALPGTVLISKVIGLYDRDELLLEKTTIDEAPALFQLATLFTLVTWIGERQLIDGHFGKDQVLGIWLCLFACAVIGRAAARRFARAATPPERIMVVGDPDACARIDAKLTGNRRVAAQVEVELPHRPRREGEYEWTPELIADVVADHAIDRMVIAPWSTQNDEVLELVRVAKGIGLNVSVLPGLFEAIGSHVRFDELDGMTVLAVPRFDLTRSSRVVKRALDLAGAAIGLLLAAPVLVLIALAIRLDSRGPVFFLQTRVGRGGRRFRIVKFRTMVGDAEALKADLLHLNQQQGLFKISDDPRVTRLGRFLRKTSLDELPQLFNVLTGDMSLVGPRPLVPDEDELVEGWSRRRLHLTPGMTGPWQILGGGRIPLQEMVKIDYLYVTGWSLWTDVKLLLRTVSYVLARESV